MLKLSRILTKRKVWHRAQLRVHAILHGIQSMLFPILRADPERVSAIVLLHKHIGITQTAALFHSSGWDRKPYLCGGQIRSWNNLGRVSWPPVLHGQTANRQSGPMNPYNLTGEKGHFRRWGDYMADKSLAERVWISNNRGIMYRQSEGQGLNVRSEEIWWTQHVSSPESQHQSKHQPLLISQLWSCWEAPNWSSQGLMHGVPEKLFFLLLYLIWDNYVHLC